jgi:uncharacterized protein (DUF1330 family)
MVWPRSDRRHTKAEPANIAKLPDLCGARLDRVVRHIIRGAALHFAGGIHETMVHSHIVSSRWHRSWCGGASRASRPGHSPAYVVIPILKINDAAAFKAGVLDKGSASAAEVKALGGHFVIRSEQFTRLDGTPPERLIVIAFDTIEKAQAWANSPTAKEVNAARIKSTNSLSFIVEGAAN